jgi:disulfide oxidoreductase YuzD
VPSAKAAVAIAESLFRLYGPEVVVRYHDVGDPIVACEHAATLLEFAQDRLPLPVVTLDDDVIFAGTINPLRVVEAVAMELHRSKSGTAT